jgi:glycosyltransferase
MESKLKISLVTACKDSAAVIADNLESVSCQGGNFDLEHLIQDGGSVDGTLARLEDYRQSVSYDVSIISAQDRGFYDAINKALSRATGDVVGLLNADDFLADESVLNKVAQTFAETPELEVLFGDLDFIRPKHGALQRCSGSATKGEEQGGHSNNSFEITRRWRAGQFSPEKFRRGWVPPHPTIYVRRRVLEKVGDYRLDMGSAADYEWMLRIFLDPKNNLAESPGHRAKRIKYLPKVMVNMRVGGQSTESLKNRLLANKMDRRAWELNGLKPAFGFRLLKPLRKILQWF